MGKISEADLEAAQRSIASTLRKNEKVYVTLSQKQSPRASQLKMVANAIDNFGVMLVVIENAQKQKAPVALQREKLEAVYKAIPSYIEQIEKIKPKFQEGTPQYTLAVRRIDAYNIALKLIEDELQFLK
ncbi:MAG: hypothetical protein RR461_02120 [Angelakisella sp.]